MLNERVKELAAKYLKGQATQEEINELHGWYDTWKDDEELIALQSNETEDLIGTKMLNTLMTKIHSPKEQVKRTAIVLKWYNIAVAAAILFAIMISVHLLNRSSASPDAQVATKPAATDVTAPVLARATITLADGTRVGLDSSANGILANQGNVKLMKTGDGQIAYEGTGNVVEQLNTLYNPRGSRVVSLTLSDGTRVWLNAESSLNYPVAFTGKERLVTITGEAYFEVAHNAEKPFKVQKGDMQVTVLGTHFNVNTYEDDSDIQVTLLEGSVKVNKAGASCIINPRQQVRVSSGLEIINDVNLEEVMSWKNGKFQFGEASDIKTIMKEIARWYDLDVEYQGVITDHIGGTISRDANASQVFKKLELTGIVSFRINGKKVIVMPK